MSVRVWSVGVESQQILMCVRRKEWLSAKNISCVTTLRVEFIRFLVFILSPVFFALFSALTFCSIVRYVVIRLMVEQ